MYEWHGSMDIATMGDMDEGDVRRLALALPDVTERSSWGRPAWFHHHMVARMWDDDRVTVRVEDDGERRALVGQEPDLFQTTDHHAGTPYLLIRLAAADEETLRAMLAESWWWAAPRSWRRTRPELGPPTARPG
ncbi:MmcQ/YjbR family DNA-binding protein [Cellulomonas sp. URHB0016]